MKEFYFYPLYKTKDRKYFKLLKLAVKERYHFIGNINEKIRFIKDILFLQLIKDYHSPLDIVFQNFIKETNLSSINQLIQETEFALDFSWVSFKHEREILERAQAFDKAEIMLIEKDGSFDEFVLRYLISIWLADWQGPLFAILRSVEMVPSIWKKLMNC